MLSFSSESNTPPPITPQFLKCKVGAFYQFCIFTADKAIEHLKFASFLSFNHGRTFRKLLYQLGKKNRAQVS